MLRIGADTRRWLGSTVCMCIVPAVAVLLWDAHLVVAPGTHLRLRDEGIDGVGAGRVALDSGIELDAPADAPS